jgi:deoxyribose-phosphate aldolase
MKLEGIPNRPELEAILYEIGRQIVDQGLGDLGRLGEQACRTLNVQICPDGLARAIDAGACRLGLPARYAADHAGLARTIDHTLLKPDATLDQVEALCEEAAEHSFASVCVNGVWVRRCAQLLAGTPVAVCTVVGFPLGACVPEVKAFEARRAIEDGACEIDMVLSIGALKSGETAFAGQDIATVAKTVHELGAKLKVILETCLLSDQEKVTACRLAKQAGADFVKTSTGFSTGGATVADIELMRRTVGEVMGIKASGGVRNQADAEAMLRAGATRIGASASVAIVSGEQGSSAY